MIMTIEHAAQHYKIASVRINELILRGHIVKCVQSSPGMRLPQVMVDTNELDRHFFDNPAQLELWQQAYEKAAQGNRL